MGTLSGLIPYRRIVKPGDAAYSIGDTPDEGMRKIGAALRECTKAFKGLAWETKGTNEAVNRITAALEWIEYDGIGDD